MTMEVCNIMSSRVLEYVSAERTIRLHCSSGDASRENGFYYVVYNIYKDVNVVPRINPKRIFETLL